MPDLRKRNGQTDRWIENDEILFWIRNPESRLNKNGLKAIRASENQFV